MHPPDLGPKHANPPGQKKAVNVPYRFDPWDPMEEDLSNITRSTKNRDDTIKQLDHYYGLVKRQLLRYQSPTSHLFPSTSSNTELANIRDSIYSAAAIWSLYQAYSRLDDDRGKSYELGQSVVACMRGIQAVWMRQSSNLQQWKNQQNTTLALHTVVGLHTGEEVLTPSQYHHLQLDVVSLYLLHLVQMVTSGLEIIYSMEEVLFTQNLVYYIERAYRTPDFGAWGRGTKYNDGSPEVNASSIGMAKAALEAVNGFNLFGERGSNYSVIYADIDAHNRNRAIFETLLPRESNTKNTDVSLLATISYPAFATQSEELYTETKSRVVEHLKGEYGFKRFLRDGFGSELEDSQRRYYTKGETLDFQGVENEWPVFYIYMIIDGIFKNLPDQVSEYRKLLSRRLVKDSLGDPLVPLMYSVPSSKVREERERPKSQKRKITACVQTTGVQQVENTSDIFLWGQAMFVISELLVHNLLHLCELDPIKRYLPCWARQKPVGRYSSFLGGTAASDLVIQVVMIAESTRLQCMLANYGIQTQTPAEVEPVQVWPPGELVRVLQSMGKSSRLGLEGRPNRPIGSLGTSKLYRVAGRTVLCYPIIFSASDFYLSHDMALLTEDIRDELRFIGKCWRLVGRPTFCILISENDMRDPQFSEMLKFFAELKHGVVDGVKVRLGRLQNLLSSSCIEHLDFLPGEEVLEVQPIQEDKHLYAGYQSLTDIPKITEVKEDLADFAGQYRDTPSRDIVEILRNLQHMYGTIQLLGILLHREGPDYIIGDFTVKERIIQMNKEAGHLRYWVVLRYSSSLLRQLVDGICPYATQIIVSGKTLTVGTVGVGFIEFSKPFAPNEIHDALYKKVQPYDMIGAVLQQELTLYCGKIIGSSPHLFRGTLCVRMGWIRRAIELYQSYLAPGSCPQTPLENCSPFTVRQLLIAVLEQTSNTGQQSVLSDYQVNLLNGCLIRVPDNFYPSVFHILKRCEGGLTFRDRHLPQLPTVTMMDPTELSFCHLVENLVSLYIVPGHRYLVVRLLSLLAKVLERNPELEFRQQAVVVDELLGSACSLYGGEEGDLDTLCRLDRGMGDSFLARAIVNLLLGSEGGVGAGLECKVQ